MSHELKIFAIKFIGLVLLTPVMGFGVMICIEKFEKSWQTNSRKKKWLASCGLFFVLAAISGWLR